MPLKLLRCPGCDSEFEHISLINIDGMLMLRVGTMILREATGVCMGCGRVIYWSVSNKMIANAIAKSIRTAMQK